MKMWKEEESFKVNRMGLGWGMCFLPAPMCNPSIEMLVYVVQARQKLSSEVRNLTSDLDALREQLEEEQDVKADLQRQLSKANTEAQQWRAKFEGEGAARAEELEESRSVSRHSCSELELVYV